MTSPIYAARQWLHDQYVASADLSGVQVTYGAPVMHQANEVVTLAGVTAIADEDLVIGTQMQHREFVLDVMFGVTSAGWHDNEAVDKRGYELHEAIRDVVVANPTLGNTVLGARPDGLDTQGTLPNEEGGWFIVGAVHVRCWTRTL